MRYTRILILGLIFTACKTSQVSTKVPEYEESLSSLRPELNVSGSDEKLTPGNDEKSVFSRHLKTELDSVNRLVIEKNRKRGVVDGYTIQIYTGNDREEAEEAAHRAMLLNPQINPKISYYQPDYKVKVGQYIDRLEAHYIYSIMKEEFPLALLIPERITVDYD